MDVIKKQFPYISNLKNSIFKAALSLVDNDGFIDNIVSFLVNAERGYELLDFPFYFNEAVEVGYEEGSRQQILKTTQRN